MKTDIIKNTLDQIPNPKPDAKRITALVKQSGKVTGYKLSDQSIVTKPEAVNMAKQGDIAGVGIAHRKNNEYLKAIPDNNQSNNLGNLPSVTLNN